MSVHLLKGSKLTGTIERVLPVRSPSLQGMVNAPPGRRRTDTILDLESVAELEKCTYGTGIWSQALPVPEVVTD